MNICARCKINEGTIIHSRRYRKRTNDIYIIYYCRNCQRERVNMYNSTRDKIKKVKYELNPNERLIRKYAP